MQAHRLTDKGERIKIPEHWTQVHNEDAYRCTRCDRRVTGREVVSARKGAPIFRHVCNVDYLRLPATGEYLVRPDGDGWMIYKITLVNE